MELDQKAAAEIAQRYFRTKQPLTRLGWGISGYVYLSPDLQTVSNLYGLTSPKLRGYRTDLKLIRMDFVRAPYLLDFAGVRFIPPDFPADTMELWHAGIEENFAPHTNIVYAVYNTLSGHGLYYLDFRPSNLKLQGHPDLMNESK
jgi:hypothetical protein